jgi:hypothetical protein
LKGVISSFSQGAGTTSLLFSNLGRSCNVAYGAVVELMFHLMEGKENKSGWEKKKQENRGHMKPITV